jgi:hypothetical protein
LEDQDPAEKKYVKKFEEGNPQEWIDMLKDLKEIWTQNSMTGGTYRASRVRAVDRVQLHLRQPSKMPEWQK